MSDEWLNEYERHLNEPARLNKRHRKIEKMISEHEKLERGHAARQLQHEHRKARLQRLLGKVRMWTNSEIENARQQMNAFFPSRSSHLLLQLQHYAQSAQRFDVTFLDREPVLDVHLNKEFARQLNVALRAKNAKLIAKLLDHLHLSDGTTVSADSVWTLNYVAPDITIAQMEGADVAEAELPAGPNGETVREMIRAVYHCASAAEEDWFVRRFIAS
jgi:hypothetical protein